MTNLTIIANEAIHAGHYTKEQIETLLEQTGTIPLHTFAEWKRLGYSVKKGAKAVITTYLWKFAKKTMTVPQPDNEEAEIDASHYYKTKAYLFTLDQVEKHA